MNRTHISRKIAVAALATVSAVILAAPAQAGSPVRPDDQAIHGPGSVATGLPAAPVRPDDRADRRLPGAADEPGLGTEPTKTPIVGDDKGNVRVGVEYAPTGGADGFNWGDAGIGAAAAFGLVLLAAGASLVERRHRRAAAIS